MEAGSEGYSRSARIVRQDNPITALRSVRGYHTFFVKLKFQNMTSFRIFWALLMAGLLFPASSPAAETWGASLFKVKRHDFGRVAIGADVEYRFEFQNEYVQDVKLLGVQSSCGCTSASLSTNLLKSGEKGAVIAKLNTSGQHTREKSATVSVVLETVVDGQVLHDMVQLLVTSFIRPDVVLTPGIVEFGSTPEGRSVVRTVQLDYSGRDDWALTKIERTHPYVHAKAEEIKRNSGEISYKITVTLKDNAPIGYVKDALRFTTSEQRPGGEAVEIVLPIQGVVMAPIHAKPSPFMVGLLAPGESVSKSIVVRSETPFRILGVESDDKRFRFTFADQASNIQIVSVLFSLKNTETTEATNLSDKIRIRTDLPDQQEWITLDALARLVPKTTEVPETSTFVPNPDAMTVETAPPTVTESVSVSMSGGGRVKFGSPRDTKRIALRSSNAE